MSSPYEIRPIRPASGHELDLVTERCMKTVLETVPEFAGDTHRAHAVLANFTFAQMRAMLARSVNDPDHAILVAADRQNRVWGHAIFSVKVDEAGQCYGFCFSRFVHPEHRRRAIATHLLASQLDWFRERGASYAIAQTHATNTALQRLFAEHGFVVVGEHNINWHSLELRLDLNR